MYQSVPTHRSCTCLQAPSRHPSGRPRCPKSRPVGIPCRKSARNNTLWLLWIPVFASNPAGPPFNPKFPTWLSSAEAFGRLLFCSYGVRGKKKIEGEWCYDRPSPSAGGLYPLEFYAACQNVGGLRDGIYHYDARAHELELRRTARFHLDIAGMMIGQEMVRDVNIVLLIAVNFKRTMWKYGQRGYRYIFLDAGHTAQNVYLVATALNLGVVSIGGFFDGELSSLVGLPGSEERVIYAVCVGSRQEATGHSPS
jgi:SagB-type dehydrogenase family enzyme